MMLRLTLILIITGAAAPAWAAFPAGWTRSCALTIQHAQVSADLTDFPVLVSYNATAANEANLPDEMMQTGNPDAAQADGGDVRFTLDAAGTTPLHYELVTFMPNATLASAKAECWVNVPKLSSSVNTTIYVWYKASSAQTTPAAADPVWGSQGVWDSHFVGVWHLPNGTALSGNDSTINANHQTNDGATAAAGSIDGAAGFDGSSSALHGATSRDSLSFSNAQSFTLSAWINPSAYNASSLSGVTNVILSRSNAAWAFSNYHLQVTDANTITFLKRKNNEVLNFYNFDSVVSLTNHWTWVTVTWEAQVATLYVNGAYSSQKNTGPLEPSVNEYLYMGGRSYLSATLFTGSMDEIRISSTARSAGWITTEYNNQFAPQTFLTRGSAGAAVQPAGVSGLSSLQGITSIAY